MAYKKLIKVSNVCQLLDKSKYVGTVTRQGITFTNNGDGTWTVVGTAPDDPINHAYVEYSILIFDKAFTTKHFIPGHKIIVGGGKVENAAWIQWVLSWSGGYTAANSSNVNSYTITEYPENFRGNFIGLRVQKGQTVNFTFKPQLFDLTEMYGAGNEPTTVEEFRQDFPDEMYDYSPYCWLTSYKRVFMTGGGNYFTSYQRNLTCKTKNLLDINSVSNLNNWVTKTTADRPYTYYQFNLKPNTTYTFSRKYASNNDTVFACFYEEYGVGGGQWFIHPTAPPLTRKQLSFTTNDTGIMYLNVYRVTGVLSSFIELIEGAQLELGDTATDYVPYGHL